jgi:translation initiation factor 2 alpha subunit (eIF-2alpha)
VLGDLNLTRQIIRDTLAPTDYQISLLIRVDCCSGDGIKLLRRTLSAFGPSRPIAFWWPTIAFGA